MKFYILLIIFFNNFTFTSPIMTREEKKLIIDEFMKQPVSKIESKTLDNLNTVDAQGILFPFILFIFTNHECPPCRRLISTFNISLKEDKKTGETKEVHKSILDILVEELNKNFKNYKNSHDKKSHRKILVFMINYEENINSLKDIKRRLPTITSFPSFFLVCRQKKCENCPNNNRSIFSEINSWVGIYNNLFNWKTKLIHEILKTVESHQYEK
ncbi:hypothetical protein AB836_01220 [Rickettsiales bacterium (ex Bugula neritina AB1)]|nr:hypothetical protein AB836_01220 [Rickettsiales bacterium (ex Bugula neritina AB1)]